MLQLDGGAFHDPCARGGTNHSFLQPIKYGNTNNLRTSKNIKEFQSSINPAYHSEHFERATTSPVKYVAVKKSNEHHFNLPGDADTAHLFDKNPGVAKRQGGGRFSEKEAIAPYCSKKYSDAKIRELTGSNAIFHDSSNRMVEIPKNR